MRKLLINVLLCACAITLRAQTNAPSKTNYVYTYNSANSNRPPFITVYPNGEFSAKGTNRHNAGSTTCGIQEALNFIAYSNVVSGRSLGGELRLEAGDYIITSGIKIPIGTSWSTFNIQGSGKSATRIVYAGTATNDILDVDCSQEGNLLSFSLKDLTITSLVDLPTNIVHLRGSSLQAGTNGFESAKIERVFIRTGTNNSSYVAGAFDSQRSFVGIDVEANYNDTISIKECSIMNCAVGISWACDWGTMQNNSISFCGRGHNLDIDIGRETTDPVYMGGGIMFRESRSPIGVVNSHKHWYIVANEFVGTYPHYLNLIALDAPSYNNIDIYFDMDEGGVLNVPILITRGTPVRFINPHNWPLELYSPDANTLFTAFYLTNVIPYQAGYPLYTDYTTWTNVPITSSMLSTNPFYSVETFDRWDSLSLKYMTNAPYVMRKDARLWVSNSATLYMTTTNGTISISGTNIVGGVGNATNAISNTNGIGTNLVIYTAGYSQYAPTLVVTNGGVAVLDTNGYQYFSASNGVVSISASNAANSTPALLVAINTNNVNEVIVPQGYAYARSLMTSNIIIGGSSAMLWNSNGVLYFNTVTGDHLVIDGR